MRFLDLIASCKACPHRRYYSAGQHECMQAGTILPLNEEHRIPAWCPLPVYPSGAMEKLAEENKQLRAQIDARTAEKHGACASPAHREGE